MIKIFFFCVASLSFFNTCQASIENENGFPIKIYGGNGTEELRLDPGASGEFKTFQNKITGVQALRDDHWEVLNGEMDYDYRLTYKIFTRLDSRSLRIKDNEDDSFTDFGD